MGFENNHKSRMEKIVSAKPATVFMAAALALSTYVLSLKEPEMCNQLDRNGVEKGKALVDDLVQNSGREYEILEGANGKFTAIVPFEKYHSSISKTVPALNQYTSSKAEFERWFIHQKNENSCSMKATSAFLRAVKDIDHDFLYVDSSSLAPVLENI